MIDSDTFNMSSISIILGDKFFKKDPQSSDLGRRIVSEGLVMLDSLGFEEFTFKKLAECIASTEASIYRYFKNKHKFLLYLSSYYWAWLEYVIAFETHHISNPSEKLDRIIDIVCGSYDLPKVLDVPGISLSKLRHVIDSESDKTYLNRQVDEINKKGLFRGYKELCGTISSVIEEINPKYEYPKALVSTFMEAAHQQSFFAQHLPSLTELSVGKDLKLEVQIAGFIKHAVKSSLK
ncbi:TetR/AcrR family transcriptional regulator [Reichenbachiella carrageenanivorans]|uniref:TetR/AcrR family transcriptional regulator n=1 Tax=Reichenbachiella carrageenanivorans TaxID=2979869 RepID=A0ABY6D4J1_9BACT|nr:TetR/AcrR family transcriptional regulator [Reichenbachiella carrageenanivorans]UXX81076.1 TetR/AcrR family transcriptional regulator [Reichenbachiella carrageenanivorans]